MSVQRTLPITIFGSPEEAPKFSEPEYEPVTIIATNVVRKGTTQGRSTVDIVLQNDKTKQKYMMLITGRLITHLATLIGEQP